MIKGKIISYLGDLGEIYYEKKSIFCTPKGLFKKIGIKPAVGDDVTFDEEKKVILEILPRKNYLLRPTLANLDKAFVVSSLKEPDFSRELLNIFLSFLAPYDLEISLIFTKVDLVSDLPFELIDDYKKLGYPCYLFSKYEDNQELLSKLNGTIAFLGQTGVGKSTIINQLIPSAKLETSSISKALGRGKHTTTKNILIPFENGFLCDTPGFSSVELSYFKEDLARFYPGFKNYVQDCYFHDCLHGKEKNCAIIKAMNEGKINPIDYEIYLKLLNGLPYRKDRFK